MALRDPAAECARQQIRPAARRIGHDDAQRPLLLLRPRDPRRGEHAKQDRAAAHGYSLTRKKCPISPTMPRRNSSTAATKMTPWITVTQAPHSAR